MLRNKYDKTFIPNNMVLVGTGISHDALVELGASVEIGRQGKRPVQSNFAMEGDRQELGFLCQAHTQCD